MSDTKFRSCLEKKLHDRIFFLEEQCRALQESIKYQRYHFLNQEKEIIDLLLRLVPYEIRSIEKVKALANSKNSWKKVFLRFPLNVKLWITVKRLKRSSSEF